MFLKYAVSTGRTRRDYFPCNTQILIDYYFFSLTLQCVNMLLVYFLCQVFLPFPICLIWEPLDCGPNQWLSTWWRDIASPGNTRRSRSGYLWDCTLCVHPSLASWKRSLGFRKSSVRSFLCSLIFGKGRVGYSFITKLWPVPFLGDVKVIKGNYICCLLSLQPASLSSFLTCTSREAGFN